MSTSWLWHNGQDTCRGLRTVLAETCEAKGKTEKGCLSYTNRERRLSGEYYIVHPRCTHPATVYLLRELKRPQ